MSAEPIVKVWLNRFNGQKLITVPKGCEIQAGDHVRLVKVGN